MRSKNILLSAVAALALVVAGIGGIAAAQATGEPLANNDLTATDSSPAQAVVPAVNDMNQPIAGPTLDEIVAANPDDYYPATDPRMVLIPPVPNPDEGVDLPNACPTNDCYVVLE